MKLRYYVEAFFAVTGYSVLRLLPLDVVSDFGSYIARRYGPRTRVHRVAEFNLRSALPNLSAKDYEHILDRMWDNLGRVVTEYPHLSGHEIRRRINIVKGEDRLAPLLREKKPVLLISGHLGNWELMPVVADHLGHPLHLLYRQANNPVVDRLVARIRKPYSLGLYAKGSAGARAVITAMRKAEPLAMLVDQKTNDGIEAMFFNHPAMSTSIVAQLALKYQATIVPCRCIRRGGARFDIIIEPPLAYVLTGNEHQDKLTITQRMNDVMERWIRDDPGQWFWVHKRWKFSKKFAV